MSGRGRRECREESRYELWGGAVRGGVGCRPDTGTVGVGGIGREWSKGVSTEDDGGGRDGEGVWSIGEGRRTGVEVGPCCVADCGNTVERDGCSASGSTVDTDFYLL